MPRNFHSGLETSDCTRQLLTFGDLIAAVYEGCGKARANGLLRLAVNAHLVAFPEGQLFMIVSDGMEALDSERQLPAQSNVGMPIHSLKRTMNGTDAYGDR